MKQSTEWKKEENYRSLWFRFIRDKSVPFHWVFPNAIVLTLKQTKRARRSGNTWMYARVLPLNRTHFTLFFSGVFLLTNLANICRINNILHLSAFILIFVASNAKIKIALINHRFIAFVLSLNDERRNIVINRDRENNSSINDCNTNKNKVNRAFIYRVSVALWKSVQYDERLDHGLESTKE